MVPGNEYHSTKPPLQERKTRQLCWALRFITYVSLLLYRCQSINVGFYCLCVVANALKELDFGQHLASPNIYDLTKWLWCVDGISCNFLVFLRSFFVPLSRPEKIEDKAQAMSSRLRKGSRHLTLQERTLISAISFTGVLVNSSENLFFLTIHPQRYRAQEHDGPWKSLV